MKRLYTEDKIPLPESSDEDETFVNGINHQDEDEPNDSEFELKDSSDDDNEQDFDTHLSQLYGNVEDSDSDSAPETFSFSAAEENRKQAQKVFAEAIRQQKEDLKRKRKELLQKNLHQKEEKRKKTEETKPVGQNEESESLQSKTNVLKESLKKFEEEITATAGNVTFKCKVLPMEAKKPKFVPEKVEHFKDQLLYGGRIRREKSNRDAVLKREKQRIKRK